MTTMIATSAAGKKTSRFRIDFRSWLFWLIMAVWALPVVWLVSMSLRDNADILSSFEVIPAIFRSIVTLSSLQIRAGSVPT